MSSPAVYAGSARQGTVEPEAVRSVSRGGKYQEYPANISSPPSPDKATVTCSRASLESRYTGRHDQSAFGSSSQAPISGRIAVSAGTSIRA